MPDGSNKKTLEERLSMIREALGASSTVDSKDLSGYLEEARPAIKLEGSSTTVRVHIVRLDGNQRPRSVALAEALALHVVDYAIPRTRVEQARRDDADQGTTKHTMLLAREADRLFNKLANSGEGGELFLFVMAGWLLDLPQILSKMSLKTDSALHFQGVDGVFAKVDADVLGIYWGESKLYMNRAGAVRDCLSSLAPVLTDPSTNNGPSARDQVLLRSHIDLNDPEVEKVVKAILNPADAAYCNVQTRGVCLVGFDFEHYPDSANTKTLEELVEDVRAVSPGWHEHIKKRLDAEGLSNYVVELLCVPLPSVDAFRRAFFEQLGISVPEHASSEKVVAGSPGIAPEVSGESQ